MNPGPASLPPDAETSGQQPSLVRGLTLLDSVLLLVSGIIDIILAGIILLGLPETAVWALGLLVGINMLFGGAALIAMAFAARQPA